MRHIGAINKAHRYYCINAETETVGQEVNLTFTQMSQQ